MVPSLPGCTLVIHLWRCLGASFGRSLCLLRSVDSLYTERLGVPGLPGPHGSRHSCLVATRFPLCGCPLFSLAKGMAHWRYSPFLSCPRCVKLPSTLLFSGLFTRPGFFRILCLVASHLVCRRLLLCRRAPLVLLALLGNGPRLLLLLGGSGRSGGRRKAQGRSQPDGPTLPMRMEAVPDHGAVLGCSRSSGRLLCSLQRLSSSPFSHTPPRSPRLQEVQRPLSGSTSTYSKCRFCLEAVCIRVIAIGHTGSELCPFPTVMAWVH